MDEREIVLMVASGDLQVDEADALLEAAQRNRSGWPTRAFDELESASEPQALDAAARPRAPRASRQGKLSPDTLIALAGSGVSPEWIRAVREAGLEGLDGDTLVGLAGSGVAPEWIRAVGAAGLIDLDGNTLVALAGTGVTPEWILTLKEAGVALGGDGVVGLAQSNVTPEWIDAISADLTPE